MKKIIATALITIVTGSASVFFIKPAQAQVQTCYPVTSSTVIEDPADHPNAYEDGYRQGRQSDRRGDKYQPRTAGGEFARGFEDGYYNRPFTSQKYVIPNKVEYYTSQQCETHYSYQNNPYSPWYYNSDPNWLNRQIHRQVRRQQKEAMRLNRQIQRQVRRQQREALKQFHLPHSEQ